jgi:elongation factor Ts
MSLDKIKKLREQTGAGIVEVKKALLEAGGDSEKAVEILRKKGQEKASKKSGRSTEEGIVVSYVHSNGRVGVIVKILCETDFVARTEEFKTLAQNIAMHITAMNPEYIRPEDVSEEVIAKEKEIWSEQLKNEGKPEKLIPNILIGKEKKFRSEAALYTQAYVKNTDQTVEELIKEKIGKIGENITVGEFKRIEI